MTEEELLKNINKKKKPGKVAESKRVSILSIKSSRPLQSRPSRPIQKEKSLKTKDLEPTQEFSARN